MITPLNVISLSILHCITFDWILNDGPKAGHDFQKNHVAKCSTPNTLDDFQKLS
jgi:hypothetical protein